MIRAAALLLSLLTAAPAFAWGHHGFFGPRVRLGFAAPRVFVPPPMVVAPPLVAPPVYVAPAPYLARPYYGPRYAPRYGHFGRHGWR